MVKVVILGSTGMLGNSVAKVFDNSNFEVNKSYRKEEFSSGKEMFYFDALNSSLDSIPECDYLINCIGIIKPYMNSSLKDNIYINSIFPHELSDWCEKNGTKMIHITTDCVFSGLTGFYTEDSAHDCLDEYGKSKSLGEPKNCMTLRTSIIGEEIHSYSSLISWVKSQNGNEISGYTNHLWNGMTTMQYGECCMQIINENLFERGLYHIHSDDVSKFELVSLIADSFNLEIKINPVVVKESCNRTLRTNKKLNSKLRIKKIKNQLESL